MSSTLIVEDGTGQATADALVSQVYVTDYAVARGLTFTGTDDLLDAAIRRATAYLCAGFTWKGQKVRGRDQSLAWPRVGVCDEEGWSVSSASVPAEVQQACAELSVYELATPGGLSPTVDLTQRVTRKKIDVLEWEYAEVPMSADSARPVLTSAMDMLSGLIESGGNSYSGRTARA